MKRVPQHEILDSDEVSPEVAAQSLRDLRWVNRWFGGVRTTTDLLRRAMRARNLRAASVLEVAAGDGYSIAQAARRLKVEGLEIEVLCLDRRRLPTNARCCERAVVGDALALPFSPASFDFVSCGLFVHHLAPAQVIDFLNGALAVAHVCPAGLHSARAARDDAAEPCVVRGAAHWIPVSYGRDCVEVREVMFQRFRFSKFQG